MDGSKAFLLSDGPFALLLIPSLCPPQPQAPTPSRSCKWRSSSCGRLIEGEAPKSRKMAKRGNVWSHRQSKALIYSKLRIAPFQMDFQVPKRHRFSCPATVL